MDVKQDVKQRDLKSFSISIDDINTYVSCLWQLLSYAFHRFFEIFYPLSCLLKKCDLEFLSVA